ncbi:MAG TPA: ABC transporter ATP-binding protein [Chthonomonadaceae bacterium]|nr:ABC transporter ATP-binding protein [Chthonomonadaceae bacterium]
MPETESTSAIAQSPSDAAVRMESITKRFPGVVANQDVSLFVRPGTFHAVIGENGAGKSTLLNQLYGRYRPDAGRIFLGGEDVTGALSSPADAIRRGLGLVSQHYALIPALSLLENVVLGAEPVRGGFIDRRAAAADIRSLFAQLQLDPLDLDQLAGRVSVAVGQKIEIVKALYRGARILLLDEPTATLAPQEADSLFALLGTLLHNGSTIVFVTHKLREVMAYSQSVTVLRAGRNAGDFLTAETNPEALLAAIIGPREGGVVRARMDTRDAARGAAGTSAAEAPARTGATVAAEMADLDLGAIAGRPDPDGAGAATGDRDAAPTAETAAPAAVAAPLLRIAGLTVRGRRGRPAVEGASLAVAPGEIVGIAGVDGSGQRELAEAIIGLRTAESGEIGWLQPDGERTSLAGRSVRARQRLGIAYIPEDRHRSGLALDFTVAENYLLGHETMRSWGGGLLLDARRIGERANAMIRRYDVRMGARDARAVARGLSGGNQQKVVVARAMDGGPRLLVACQPTRGLDVAASQFVYRTLREARDRGLAILLFSLDLDELLDLSDRIVVMYNGRIAGELARTEATAESVGALMTGAIRPDAMALEARER